MAITVRLPGDLLRVSVMAATHRFSGVVAQ